MGLDGSEIKSCCNQRLNLTTTKHYICHRDVFKSRRESFQLFRYTQCNDFVSSKPWKAGVERYFIILDLQIWSDQTTFCHSGLDGDGQEWITPSFFSTSTATSKDDLMEGHSMFLLFLTPEIYALCQSLYVSKNWFFVVHVFLQGKFFKTPAAVLNR